VAVAAAFVAAEAALLLLRPRDGVITPAPVEPGSYFTPDELARARGYRRGQLVLFGASAVVESALLGWLVRRPPSALLGRRDRPLATAAVAGSGLSVAVTAAQLPISAIAHRRSVGIGLSTQRWGPWLGDVGKSSAIGAAFAGAGSTATVGLMRRFPRGWWAGGGALVLAFAVTTLYLGPVVLDPIFNRFTPLPDGATRDDVLELAREAGVDVGEVFEVDASRRTTASNAYVTGLGATKRVVLYDNLMRDFTRDEVRLVVAHELAHVHYRDVVRGLAYAALVAPAGALATARLTEQIAPGEPGPATLPALAVAAGLVGAAITTIANRLSRRIEARADSYALRLTDAPEAFVGFERGIAVRNVADPDPPRWLTALLATHPPVVERIGIAKAYEAGAR
jgi:STE24 endopeptidase